MAINVIQPEHGALAVSVSDGVATIAATPDVGYRLDWVKAESGGGLLEVVDMAFEVPEEGDVDVSGAFAAEDAPTPTDGQHFIDASYSNGEVRFEVGGSAVVAAYAGDVVEIVAKPFVGYELGAITGADVTGMRFTMPDANVSLSIEFRQVSYAVACGEFVQADVSTAHAGDTVTAIPTGLDDGQVFLGFVVECPELGVCAWALDVTIEFEMPAYAVTVRQMTEAEAEEYAQVSEDDGETGSGDEQDDDPEPPPITPEPDQEAAESEDPGVAPPDTEPAVPDIHEDVPTKTITTYIDEMISDFSAASLAAYEAAGAVAIAVYEDGTEAQVPWSSVEDPAQEGAEAVNEAWAVANATNQHFWHRATAPEGDTAGTGAFVTDEEQEDFLAAIAAGAEPTTARPLHNLLMNSNGIIMRAAKRINSAFTRGAVAFYDGLWDGEGDGSSHIVAKFGSGGAQVGKDGSAHIGIDPSAVSFYSETNAKILDIRTKTDEDYGTTGGVFFKSSAGMSVRETQSGNSILSEMFITNGGATVVDPDAQQVYGVAGDTIIEASNGDYTEHADIRLLGSDGQIYLTSTTGEYHDFYSGSFDVYDRSIFPDYRLVRISDGSLTGIGRDNRPAFSMKLDTGRLNIYGDGALNGTTAVLSGDVECNRLIFGKGATGTRYYLVAKTPERTGHVLWAGGGKKADGDANGTVVGLGAGGLTIVGGGEYANNRYNVGDLNDTAEYLYLGSDNDVYIETNGNTIANRKTFRFSTGGVFWVPPGGSIEADKRIDLGDRSVSGIDYHARLETSSSGTLHLVASSGGYSSSNTARGDFALISDGRLGVRKHNGTDWVSGWAYYDFTSAATLRDSIDAEKAGTCLPLSGGTLTGHLYLSSGKILYAKNTTHDVAASSLSAQTDQNVAVCLDKNSNATAGILSRQLTTGEMRGIFQARHNNASGTAVWNALQLGVKPDGTRTVTLSDEAPWLSALGLGSTTTATSGVVTAASGWTVVLQSLASWGRVRMLHLRVKNASATSGTRKVATLAAAHKPKGPDAAIAVMYSPTSGSGYVSTSGDIYIGGSLAANAEWNGMLVWLV